MKEREGKTRKRGLRHKVSKVKQDHNNARENIPRNKKKVPSPGTGDQEPRKGNKTLTSPYSHYLGHLHSPIYHVDAVQ